jgi:hypothetical protein
MQQNLKTQLKFFKTFCTDLHIIRMGEVTRIEDGFVVGIAAAQLHSTPGFRPEIIPNNYNLSLGF